MWKFSELPYERVDVDKFIADGLKLIEAFENAKTAQEAIDAYYAMDEASQKVATMFTISHIRHDVNTKDEFYDAEQTYYDQNLSKTMVLNERQLKAMVNHPFRKELEAELGKIVFTQADAQVKLADERLIPGMTKDQMLRSKYAKLTAGKLHSLRIPFPRTLRLHQGRRRALPRGRQAVRRACRRPHPRASGKAHRRRKAALLR